MYLVNMEEEKLRNMTEKFINYLEDLRKDNFITGEQFKLMTKNKVQFIKKLNER